MPKNKLLIRQRPVIDETKAQQLIASAPPTATTVEEVGAPKVTEKSKPGPKPKEEKIQPYMLKFSSDLHKRTKLASLTSNKVKTMREWIMIAIEEKLRREGF